MNPWNETDPVEVEMLRQTRLIEFFNNVQDDFYKFSKWPKLYQKMILQPHKNNVDRFTLFVFLTSNGLPPDLAWFWVLCGDYYGGALHMHPSYGRKHNNHMAQMVRQYEAQAKGEGRFWNPGKKMYNFIEGRVIDLP